MKRIRYIACVACLVACAFEVGDAIQTGASWTTPSVLALVFFSTSLMWFAQILMDISDARCQKLREEQATNGEPPR